MSASKENKKIFTFRAVKKMVKNSEPIIKEGDIVTVDLTKKPRKNSYGLFTCNTVQWIEKYIQDYKDTNVYKIIKVELGE